MVDLDDAGDPVGDDLRDRMDGIWLNLSAEDRAALDSRSGNPSLFAGLAGPQGVAAGDLDNSSMRLHGGSQEAVLSSKRI